MQQKGVVAGLGGEEGEKWGVRCLESLKNSLPASLGEGAGLAHLHIQSSRDGHMFSVA